MTSFELVVALNEARQKKRFGLAGRINREIEYQRGREDRTNGKPCFSADGAYIDGYYANDAGLHFTTYSELRELMGA